MKKHVISVRIEDSLWEKIEYLKLCPGGITKFIEDQLRLVKVKHDLLKAWRQNRQNGE